MLSDTTLSLLPSKALAATSNSLTGKAMSTASNLSAAKSRMKRLEGFSEASTTFNGKQAVSMSTYTNTAQKSLEQATGVASTASLAKTLSDGGQAAFKPGSLPPGVTGGPEEIAAMNSELESTVGKASDLASSSKSLFLMKAQLSNQIEALTAVLDSTNESLNKVQSTLNRRATGELPNPELNYENIALAVENIIASQTVATEEELASLRKRVTAAANQSIDDFQDYIVNRVIIPYEQNTAALDIIAAQLTGDAAPSSEEDPIFDTVFGPPVSYTGKFILSEDGIYYDSRSGGIPFIAAQKIDATAWQLRYSSNRGGKGEMYGQDRAGRLADTIFDKGYENESGNVLDFYKYDDILLALRNDRDLRIQDVSGKIDDLIASGYTADSATIKNYKETYAALAYETETKLDKRKKQLQVAALFGPFGVTDSTSPVGPGAFYREVSPETSFLNEAACGSYVGGAGKAFLDYSNSGVDVTPGSQAEFEPVREFIPRIPVNDFTYLKEIGMVPGINAQQSAMLISEDLDSTTKPVAPTFLERGPSSPIQAIPEMSVSPYGITDWVNTSGDTDLEGTIPYIRTLADSIVTRDLIACYNFLEPSAVVTSPSSVVYGVRNYARTGVSLDGKMVGTSPSAIFTSGVSIPYLEGTLYNPSSKYGVRYAHLPKGSYVRLPSNFKNGSVNPASAPLDNLMYNSDGWTFDFWSHIPSLVSGMTPSHRYRVVIANENCGDPLFTIPGVFQSSVVTAEIDNNLANGYGTRTKGIVIGFRDKGDPSSEITSSGIEFVVLPTVSQNDPKWGKSVCIAETVEGAGTLAECRQELGFKVPATTTSVSGYTVSSCVSGFTHYSLTCDLGRNAISLFVNGHFLASSTVSSSFGTIQGQALNFPSRISKGFFQGDGVHGEEIADTSLPAGVVFTPWVIGGGFTDGIDHETPAIFSSTFPGFLGTNTNDDYFEASSWGPSGGPIGQHTDIVSGIPGLGGYTPAGTAYELPRSGLEGHLGSFKIYKTPLTKEEVTENYEAQNPFFSGIQVPHRLL